MAVPKVPKRVAPEGAAILDEVHAALGRYVVFPSPEAHDAATLYIAATHGSQRGNTRPGSRSCHRRSAAGSPGYSIWSRT
jgi:hypothetical protein